jgi:GH18 family chitinase
MTYANGELAINSTQNALKNSVHIKNMQAAKKLGIKTIINLGSWNEAEAIETIAVDPKFRSIMVTRAVEILDKYNADGICFVWTWPSCPMVNDVLYHFSDKFADGLRIENMQGRRRKAQEHSGHVRRIGQKHEGARKTALDGRASVRLCSR